MFAVARERDNAKARETRQERSGRKPRPTDRRQRVVTEEGEIERGKRETRTECRLNTCC
jgi:hypothetical protein